jgi:DNA repair exonuclease SbcCD ATPase subunit
MEASEAAGSKEPRVIRLADAPDAVELDTTDLLARLEAQAEENGRLAEKAESFERVARAERDARRRLSDTLRREREAAEALHARLQEAEAGHAAQAEEAKRLAHSLKLVEQQKQMIWSQLTEVQGELALKSRPVWRKVLRRPPKG